MATRVCRKCGEERDLEADFYKSPGSRGGRNTMCKRCIRETRIGNPSYYKVFTCGGCGAGYQRKGRVGSRSLCAQCAPKGKLCRRCNEFKPLDRYCTSGGLNRYCNEGCVQSVIREQRYGLAPGTAETVFAQFPECCAICGVAQSAGPQKTLVVDHCHNSGSIRGLLCRQCNMALGLLKDDPQLLAAAIKYLKQTRQLSFDETAA